MRVFVLRLHRDEHNFAKWHARELGFGELAAYFRVLLLAHARTKAHLPQVGTITEHDAVALRVTSWEIVEDRVRALVRKPTSKWVRRVLRAEMANARQPQHLQAALPLPIAKDRI